jgi:hypothetical protein
MQPFPAGHKRLEQRAEEKMLRHWMRRVGSAKIIALATIGLLTSSALMETASAASGARVAADLVRSAIAARAL